MTIEIMKKVFTWSLLTLIYLLVLGQGCSALKDQPKSISFKIPTIRTQLKTPLVKVKKTPAPIKEVVVEKRVTKLPVRKIKPIKKKEISYEPPKKKVYKVAEPILEARPLKEVKVIKKKVVKERRKHDLNNDYPINHYGFSTETKVTIVAWSKFYGEGIEAELNRIALESETKVTEEDVVKVAQAAPANKNIYDPSDPKMLAMFEQQEITIEPVKEVEPAAPDTKNDELVLIDYSESENIHDVANTTLSSAVQKVIDREMGSQVMAKQRAATPAKMVSHNSWQDILKNTLEGNSTKKEENKEANNEQSRVTLYALEANLNKGFGGDVRNFSFVPTYDDRIVYEDFNEGKVNYDYSLKNNTGVLRGTISKNYFMRTTFEIPLGSEYSKFEIPMITQDSMIEYLEEAELDGFGGYYLVDMGEMIADVELEKSSFKGLPYQHRILLNDEFRKTKNNVRYILFIGVDPGNVSVRYLGINGQETSKITFIAPDELTYDFSQMVRPSELSIATYLRNTLGKSKKPLSLAPEKIINFTTGESPTQKVPGEYSVQTPWKIKGSRTYLEVGHLGDSIFVGLDGDKEITLPSREFIGEVLKSFSIDGMNHECLLQLNIESNIKDIRVFGEGARGPTVYDTAYLDTEGVFTAEISPISEKLFILGNEEGIFNIKVDYQDGTQDYLRTYCSPSTYLLEQL